MYGTMRESGLMEISPQIRILTMWPGLARTVFLVLNPLRVLCGQGQQETFSVHTSYPAGSFPSLSCPHP